MKITTLAAVVVLAGTAFSGVYAADKTVVAKHKWAATEQQKACTAKCKSERDSLAYETCMIECNKSAKPRRNQERDDR